MLITRTAADTVLIQSGDDSVELTAEEAMQARSQILQICTDISVDQIPASEFVYRLPKPVEDRIAELKAEGKTPEEATVILKREGLI